MRKRRMNELTEKDKAKIAELYLKHGVMQIDICERFGIYRTTVEDIVNAARKVTIQSTVSAA